MPAVRDEGESSGIGAAISLPMPRIQPRMAIRRGPTVPGCFAARKKARNHSVAGLRCATPNHGLHRPSLRSLRLGVDPDAVVLLVVVDHVAGEELEGFVAALVENLVAGLVEVLLDLVRRSAPACRRSWPPRRCGRR